MDMSVLERQRLVHHKRRHHHHQQQQQIHHQNLHSTNRLDHHQQLQLSHSSNWQHFNHPPQPLFSPDTSQQMNHHNHHHHHSNSINNSSMSRVCNDTTSSSIKKRKPEFDIEEDKSGGKLYGSTEEEEEEQGGEEQSEITIKTDRENSTNETSKVSEVQKPDYIHVRARRGQATDSHSLAERARREKISKKMKCLQDLVPGCNKVTGKAGMLDEIINYVQSLQKQVEFLSMKLAVSNPRLDFNIDNLFTKEIPAYIASLHAAATQLEASNLSCFQYNQMQMNQPLKEGSSSLPISEAFLDPSCIPQLQQLPGWDSEWTSQFNLGFH